MPAKTSKPLRKLFDFIVRSRAATADLTGICETTMCQQFLAEDLFRRLLCIERQRTERSRRPFALMLLRSKTLEGIEERVLSPVLSALCRSTRDTDLKGWYENGSVIGVIFTEVENSPIRSIEKIVLGRVQAALTDVLTAEQVRSLVISFHVFPQESDGRFQGGSGDLTLYPDLQKEMHGKTAFGIAKRAMDIIVSVVALVLLSPVLAAIAIAIKINSSGPLLFKQERLGQYGKGFTFLKFRSMYVSNDHTCHEEYVKLFISGKANPDAAGGNRSTVYKLTRDSRITGVGKFLRRTSMDELPQLFNVLLGDMSLVGPRPPIRYEFEAYDMWHKRRLLEARSGITGLWQVTGRSTTKFDEMVRLDLRYARSRSLWLDIKILLQTPRAVFFGGGAY